MRVLRQLGFTSCRIGCDTDTYVARAIGPCLVIVGEWRVQLAWRAV